MADTCYTVTQGFLAALAAMCIPKYSTTLTGTRLGLDLSYCNSIPPTRKTRRIMTLASSNGRLTAPEL